MCRYVCIYVFIDGSFQSQNAVLSPTASLNDESLLTKKNNQNIVQTHVIEGLSKHMNLKQEAVSLIYTCEAIIGEISVYHLNVYYHKYYYYNHHHHCHRRRHYQHHHQVKYLIT
jgi:hypothetical protein